MGGADSSYLYMRHVNSVGYSGGSSYGAFYASIVYLSELSWLRK